MAVSFFSSLVSIISTDIWADSFSWSFNLWSLNIILSGSWGFDPWGFLKLKPISLVYQSKQRKRPYIKNPRIKYKNATLMSIPSTIKHTSTPYSMVAGELIKKYSKALIQNSSFDTFKNKSWIELFLNKSGDSIPSIAMPGSTIKMPATNPSPSPFTTINISTDPTKIAAKILNTSEWSLYREFVWD